jgi:hypothetical protein
MHNCCFVLIDDILSVHCCFNKLATSTYTWFCALTRDEENKEATSCEGNTYFCSNNAWTQKNKSEALLSLELTRSSFIVIASVIPSWRATFCCISCPAAESLPSPYVMVVSLVLIASPYRIWKNPKVAGPNYSIKRSRPKVNITILSIDLNLNVK